MPEWYVSPTATGGGVGSVGNPWTIDEMEASVNGGTIAAGDRVNLKDNAVHLTSGIGITKAGSYQANIIYEGYTATPGDGGRATVERSGGTAILWQQGGGYSLLRNLIFDGQAAGAYTLYLQATYTAAHYVEIKNSGGVGVTAGFPYSHMFDCYAHNNAGDGFENCIALNCFSASNGGIGFDQCDTYDCISKGNTGKNYNIGWHRATRCISDGGANDGFSLSYTAIMTDCIAVSSPSGKNGLNSDNPACRAFNCCFHGNASAFNSAAVLVNYTLADPQFKDKANNDYTRIGSNLDQVGYSRIGMQSATSYKTPIGIDQATGFPAQGNVRSGIDYRGTVYSGNVNLPTANNVSLGVTYGSSGSEYTGTAVLQIGASDIGAVTLTVAEKRHILIARD